MVLSQSDVFTFQGFFEIFFGKFCSFANLNVIVAKGETSPAFADAKGGENVKPTSHEQGKRHAFDSFCKKVLKHEARDYYGEKKRQRAKEVLFSELSVQELEQLATADRYFATEQIFRVSGHDVIVNNETIAEALKSLPQRKRDIILLSYFLELSDGEIGKTLNLIRATVQYQRASTLKQLKKYLEEVAGEEE